MPRQFPNGISIANRQRPKGQRRRFPRDLQSPRFLSNLAAPRPEEGFYVTVIDSDQQGHIVRWTGSRWAHISGPFTENDPFPSSPTGNDFHWIRKLGDRYWYALFNLITLDRYLYRSEDLINWELVAQMRDTFQADLPSAGFARDMLLDIDASGKLYLGIFGGSGSEATQLFVYTSIDAGESWELVHNTIIREADFDAIINQLYGLRCSPVEPDRVCFFFNNFDEALFVPHTTLYTLPEQSFIQVYESGDFVGDMSETNGLIYLENGRVGAMTVRTQDLDRLVLYSDSPETSLLDIVVNDDDFFWENAFPPTFGFVYRSKPPVFAQDLHNDFVTRIFTGKFWGSGDLVNWFGMDPPWEFVKPSGSINTWSNASGTLYLDRSEELVSMRDSRTWGSPFDVDQVAPTEVWKTKKPSANSGWRDITSGLSGTIASSEVYSWFHWGIFT